MNPSAKKVIVFLTAIGLALAGCGKNTGTPAPGEAEVLRIAVIPKGMTHEFWKSIHAGALRAAR